jgi:hypothetical protein
MEFCYEWVKARVHATMFNPKNKQTDAATAKFTKLFDTEENKKTIDDFLTGASHALLFSPSSSLPCDAPALSS